MNLRYSEPAHPENCGVLGCDPLNWREAGGTPTKGPERSDEETASRGLACKTHRSPMQGFAGIEGTSIDKACIGHPVGTPVHHAWAGGEASGKARSTDRKPPRRPSPMIRAGRLRSAQEPDQLRMPASEIQIVIGLIFSIVTKGMSVRLPEASGSIMITDELPCCTTLTI
jgi:hypothetical protein